MSPVRVLRRPWAVAAVLAGAIIATGSVGGLVWASQTGRAARPAASAGKPALIPIPRGHWAARPQPTAAPVPLPVRLDIPAIGVRTQLIRLGITKAGTLQVPSSTAVAGWYTGSARPGAIGAAIIAGHIDSYLGPGVFYRLNLLKPGELVYVRRANHSLAVFRVTSVHSYLKTKFPTEAVYGPVPDAQLRLITCGGTFDEATGHYLSNVVVFAILQPGHRHGTRRPGASRRLHRKHRHHAR